MQTVAIELSFDSLSDRRLTAIWAKLEREYPKCGVAELGARPHVSLAVFREAEPPQLEQVVSTLAAKLPLLVLDFVRVSTFRSIEGVVFLAPAASAELEAAHAALMSLLGAAKSAVHPYYRENTWVPHCTIATGVPPTSLDHVLHVARESGALGPATVCRVSAVRYRPTRELHSASTP